MCFYFDPTLKKQILPLNPLKIVSKIGDLPSAIAMTIFVRTLRSTRLDTAWLVKSLTYFDLIGWIGECGREFQRSKYKFSSHPETLELTGQSGIMCVPDPIMMMRSTLLLYQ